MKREKKTHYVDRVRCNVHLIFSNCYLNILDCNSLKKEANEERKKRVCQPFNVCLSNSSQSNIVVFSVWVARQSERVHIFKQHQHPKQTVFSLMCVLLLFCIHGIFSMKFCFHYFDFICLALVKSLGCT